MLSHLSEGIKNPEMNKVSIENLSRRQRQILDIIYGKGSASAAEVRELLPDPPSYSTVRALLSILENDKQLITHSVEGKRYVYRPCINTRHAGKVALKHLLKTFYENSANSVVAALLDMSGKKMSDREYEDLKKLIDKARKRRKG